MTPKLTPDDVRRVAALAELELTPDEVDRFGRQLAGILEYVEALRLVDTTDVPPTSHASAGMVAWREDETERPLDRSAALANAPDAARDAGLFRVPKVL